MSHAATSWIAPPGYRFDVPPFPNGWFQVAYSDELLPGSARPLHYFGQHLVLYRGADGVARVLDAYCPHLGAHLGHGGAVEADCIRCPFHAWRFDGSGRCVEIPYARKVPPAAFVRAWPVREVAGLVMVWHDMEGRPPAWELPGVPEHGSPEWTDYQRRRWRIRTHNQDMAENAVDAAHFKYVHALGDVPATRAETDGPILRVRSAIKYPAHFGDVEGLLTSTNWGFGFSTAHFTGIVETLLVATMTPIDGEYIDVRFSFLVRKLDDEAMTAAVGSGFIMEVERQLGQDIPIWENKIMRARPVLAEGDGPIATFRRWCRQFYGSAPALSTPALGTG